MLELINNSLYKAGLFPGWDSKRNFQITMVAKVTYSFNESGELRLLENQPDIIEVDEYRDKPLNSSLIKVNETGAFKQGSELYCYATAYSPGKKTKVMEVGLGVLFNNQTEWKKVLRVYGDRHWKKTILNYVMGKTSALNKTLPIAYEYAYGGRHSVNDEYEWALNPVGLGYNHSSRNLLSYKLPNIELGPNFITSPMQNTKAAGFSPLPLFWEPRASATGKINEVDFKNIENTDSVDSDECSACPYGKDALPTLHHVAPEDQWFTQAFTGGEVIHVRGLMENVAHKKTVKLIVPELMFTSYSIVNNDAKWLAPVCDTVILDTDEKTLSLIYRASVLWDIFNVKQGYVVLDRVSEEDASTDNNVTNKRIVN